MIAGSLARRYARALLDLGIEQHNFEKLAQELDDLAALYSASRDLVEALTNPIFTRQKRRAVLEEILAKMGVQPAMRNFTLLLLDRERIVYLADIAREYRAMVDAKVGRVRGVITSATPLPEGYAAELGKALTRASGKKVILETKEDPSLIGGVVAKIGDVLYDGSIRTQLELMRERILTD